MLYDAPHLKPVNVRFKISAAFGVVTLFLLVASGFLPWFRERYYKVIKVGIPMQTEFFTIKVSVFRGWEIRFPGRKRYRRSGHQSKVVRGAKTVQNVLENAKDALEGYHSPTFITSYMCSLELPVFAKMIFWEGGCTQFTLFQYAWLILLLSLVTAILCIINGTFCYALYTYQTPTPEYRQTAKMFLLLGVAALGTGGVFFATAVVSARIPETQEIVARFLPVTVSRGSRSMPFAPFFTEGFLLFVMAFGAAFIQLLVVNGGASTSEVFYRKRQEREEYLKEKGEKWRKKEREVYLTQYGRYPSDSEWGEDWRW